jgi:hypothetical protein
VLAVIADELDVGLAVRAFKRPLPLVTREDFGETLKVSEVDSEGACDIFNVVAGGMDGSEGHK